MYAIIKSGSRQYQVRPESVIEVNRLALEEGAAFETDEVLLFDNDGQDVQIGTPFVSGAKVKGKVLSHLRGRKIIIFKHKRRKNYRRTRGHRQELTRLLIEAIEVGGKTTTTPGKEAIKAAPKAEKPAEEKAGAAAEKPKAAAKPKAAEKKAAETKAAEKKAAEKPKAEAKPKADDKPKTEAKSTAKEPAKATKKPAAKATGKDTAKAAPKARDKGKTAKPKADKDKS